MIRFIYNLLLSLAIPLLLWRQLSKEKKAKGYQEYSQNGRWKERLGFLPKAEFKAAPIWLHAVSMGEFIAAKPLIDLLKEKHPNIPLIITTTTQTGSAEVRKSYGNTVYHVYLPWDLPWIMARFYKNLNPRLGLLMETEIWPNLIREANKANTPLMLLNARLSAKSAKGYGRFASISADMLRGLDKICAQSADDGTRFIALGALSEQVVVCGSIKFDLDISRAPFDLAMQLKKALNWQDSQVLIAASTHEGEDELILATYQNLKKSFDNLKLIIVPRHPERFNRVFELVNCDGLKAMKRSLVTISEKPHDREIDILLGDSMGEMMMYFYLSHIVFMGGTFVENGGHNILEPAALGLPIFYGPSMFNFKTINEQFLARGASCQVKSQEQLQQQLRDYLAQPNKLQAMGEAAKEIMLENAGAKEKLYGQIKLTGQLNG